METYISDKKLKDAGIQRLEPTRGLQVMQRLRCLKHNEEFIGILSNVMSRKQAGVNAGLANPAKAQAKLDKRSVNPGMFTAVGTVPSTNAAYTNFIVARCNTCTTEFTYSE